MQPAIVQEEGSLDFCHHSTSLTSTLVHDITSPAINGIVEDKACKLKEGEENTPVEMYKKGCNASKNIVYPSPNWQLQVTQTGQITKTIQKIS